MIAIVADHLYLQGIKLNSLDKFIAAKKLFPYDRNLALADIEYYIKFQIISDEAFESAKQAVKVDPYSAKFNNVLMQYAALYKDRPLVVKHFKMLKRLAPNDPTVKELIRLGAKLEE